jgi:hypothetical protein
MAQVTFIRGIGNKTPAETLPSSWPTSRADNDGWELEADGVSSSVAFWADFLYETPARVRGCREASWPSRRTASRMSTWAAWATATPRSRQPLTRAALGILQDQMAVGDDVSEQPSYEEWSGGPCPRG